MPRTKLSNAIRFALMYMLLALVAGCAGNVRPPAVPQTVTIAVAEYRDLPAWIQIVPVYERSGTTVRDHLTAECRHKADQAIANCLITASQRIVAGQKVEKAECELVIRCEDGQ